MAWSQLKQWRLIDKRVNLALYKWLAIRTCNRDGEVQHELGLCNANKVVRQTYNRRHVPWRNEHGTIEAIGCWNMLDAEEMKQLNFTREKRQEILFSVMTRAFLEKTNKNLREVPRTRQKLWIWRKITEKERRLVNANGHCLAGQKKLCQRKVLREPTAQWPKQMRSNQSKRKPKVSLP